MPATLSHLRHRTLPAPIRAFVDEVRFVRAQLRPIMPELTTKACPRAARVLLRIVAACMCVKHKLPGVRGVDLPIWLSPSGLVWVNDWSQLCVAHEVFSPPGAYDFLELPPEPTTIVDLGANCGLSTRWLSNRFPRARVIAYEPDPVTWHTAVRNVRNERAHVHCAAVARVSGSLELWRRPGQSWGSSVHETWGVSLAQRDRRDPIRVPAITLDSVVDEVGPIDLLKIDIEGAEYDVLRACFQLDQIMCIAGEFHPQAGVSHDAFFALLDQYDVVEDICRGTFVARRGCLARGETRD